MRRYLESAWERAMKFQEVILRAMAKRISWCQAAEILGISDRSIRRWRERYQKQGYDGLLDRRRGKPSGKRVAVEVLEEVLRLPAPVQAYSWSLDGTSRLTSIEEVGSWWRMVSKTPTTRRNDPADRVLSTFRKARFPGGILKG
jgi:transposase